MTEERNRVCPVERAGILDNRLRRWLQDPRKILAPFVRPGMTVLDVGCGPGFFSLEMARMVGPTGKVISVDLQDGMLQKLSARIRGTELEDRIRLVKCSEARIDVPEKVDFGLAFYMVHEVPDKASFFEQLRGALNEKAQILMVEPKWFHVSRKDFYATMALAKRAGLLAVPGPPVLLSWSAILQNAS